MRVLIDTNILISAALSVGGTPFQAYVNDRPILRAAIEARADFLYQHRGDLWRFGRGGVCGLHGTGFFAYGGPFSGRLRPVKQSHSLFRFTRSLAAALVAPAFSSRKSVPTGVFLQYLLFWK